MKKLMLTLLTGAVLVTTPINVFAAADAQKSTAKDQAAMEAMMKLANPGENHKLLAPLVGEWTHTVRMWMEPNAPVQESTGTNTNTLILNGRFLEGKTKGTMVHGDQTQPFEGIGLLGYDNVKKEFNSVWLNDMATGMMIAKGQYDAKTKTITESGTVSCPMTGNPNEPFRSELKLIDNDNYSYTMYAKDKAGKEFKSLEIVYKRKK